MIASLVGTFVGWWIVKVAAASARAYWDIKAEKSRVQQLEEGPGAYEPSTGYGQQCVDQFEAYRHAYEKSLRKGLYCYSCRGYLINGRHKSYCTWGENGK